jgi:hypothetical protein
VFLGVALEVAVTRWTVELGSSTHGEAAPNAFGVRPNPPDSPWVDLLGRPSPSLRLTRMRRGETALDTPDSDEQFIQMICLLKLNPIRIILYPPVPNEQSNDYSSG